MKTIDTVGHAKPTVEHVVTPANIDRESYYNLVQLCRLTHFANPIAAIKARGESWGVVKDECGNILCLSRDPRPWTEFCDQSSIRPD